MVAAAAAVAVAACRSRRTPSHAHQELPEEAKPARDLLRDILERMGVRSVDISYISRPEGEYLEITGPDLASIYRPARQHARGDQPGLQQRV